MSQFVCETSSCAIAISKAAFPVKMNCPVCQKQLSLITEFSALSEYDEQLIESLPYVIAYPLKITLLEKHAWTKVNLFKDTFLNYLKYLGLLTASEFYNSPIKDKKMVALFHQTLAEPSFGTWNQFIRETLIFLKEHDHVFFCPELPTYYESVETGKKRKLFKGEIEYVDGNGDVQLKKHEATAIGILISFRNRYLGHGLTLDEGASQKLWDEYNPIFRDLLEKLDLAIHYPMFKHEHGESYLLSSAEISPIEKGLQTPGRVWVENKDRKSMDILPFFVVPGEVSIGKEDKEQILTYESYTGKTIKFFSPEGTEKQTSGKLLEKLNLLLRDKQKEQPYSPEHFNKEVFLTRVADENKLTLDTLIAEKKVITGVYVHREQIEIKLREWIGARANIFFIAAEAGSGKTNLLVEIQRQYLERNLSSLLIRTCRMEKQSLKEQIAYLLNLDSSLDLKNYTAISGTQGEPIFILIDGLNEANNAEELWKEVIELSKIFVLGSLKFVITSRANSKSDIERYTHTKEDEIFIYGENNDRENGLAAFVYWLTPLNMVEMKTAWEDYTKKDKNKFKPLFAFDDLAAFDRSLYNQISNPLVLRLFLETYHGKKLPEKGNQYLNIWKDWFSSFSEEEQTFMKLLAAEIWEKGENELMLDEMIHHEKLRTYFTSDLINSPYHRLKNLGWISRYVKDMMMYVAFTVEGALVYLLGHELYVRNLQLEDIQKVLEKDNKLKSSAVEVFLSQKAIEGDLVLVTELIDLGANYIELCVNPLLTYLKTFGSQSLIDEVLKNPTENDWKVLFELDTLIEELELHINRKDLFQELMAVNTFDSTDKISYALKGVRFLNKDIAERYLVIIYSKEEFIKDNFDILIQIGESEIELGNYENAIRNFQRCLEIISNNFEIEDLKIATLHHNLSFVFERKGEYTKAVNHIEKSISIKTRIFGHEHSKLISEYNSLGLLHTRVGEFDLAIDKFQICFGILLKTFGEFHSMSATLYNNLGLALKNKGDYLGALNNYEKSASILLSTFGNQNGWLATSYNNIGIIYKRIEEFEKALSFCQKAFKIRLEIYGKNHYDTASSLHNIGTIHFCMGENKKALRFFQDSLRISIKMLKKNHPNVSITCEFIGDTLLILKEIKQAKEAYIKAITYNKTDRISLKIAQCYEALNNQENALDYYIQSATIRKDDPEVGLVDEATQEAISNAKRLSKELGKEDELPVWMR